jgi:hypothetical protein
LICTQQELVNYSLGDLQRLASEFNIMYSDTDKKYEIIDAILFQCARIAYNLPSPKITRI